ncbi:MAG TPA: LysR family transcriptional regulator [Burkholderiales bacterium]|nr:LysR family transcriptional regulator [Burkholderiales bacterium]
MAGMQTFLAFAETAKRGSFAEAARELGLSASAVAKGVGRLEADLGLRLFHRTTRQVTLTSEGHELYARCRRIVDEIEALRDDASGARAEPSGTLRLNAPLVLGRMAVVPALAALVRRYPKITLEVGFSDRYVDLVREGLDAVVRIGHLPDSTLVGRHIGDQTVIVVAAPRYLRERGTPRTPADLAGHLCLLFRNPSTGRPRPWQFQERQRSFERMPVSATVMNDGEALVAAAAAGMGLIQVPDYMAGDALRAGRLVEVLGRYRSAPLPISLVYPSTRRVTPRLRALIEVLAAPGVTRALGGTAPRRKRGV